MTTKDALKIAELAIDGLDHIQRLTSFGGAGATAALASISHFVGILQQGAAGKASAADVERELAELRSRLKDNDDAADAELREKFKQP